MKTRHLFALVFGFFCLEEAAAQENIMEARESGVGAVVTVVGVVTSDENLGSVRYIQDETAGIAIYPGQDWSAWGGGAGTWRQSLSHRRNHGIQWTAGGRARPDGGLEFWYRPCARATFDHPK